jgi:hypothetical protein
VSGGATGAEEETHSTGDIQLEDENTRALIQRKRRLIRWALIDLLWYSQICCGTRKFAVAVVNLFIL